MIERLSDLCKIAAPSGNEAEIREFIKNKVEYIVIVLKGKT